MEMGVPNEGHFARKRFVLPQLLSFARLCPALFLWTGLAIAGSAESTGPSGASAPGTRER